MSVEWDPAKDRANREKHEVSFDEASELFTSGADHLEIFDEEHSDDEERFIAIGPIPSGIVVVVYTEPSENVTRLISARTATKHEIQLFYQYIEGAHE